MANLSLAESWLPIETAPKDGTVIWTQSKNGGGYWLTPMLTRMVDNPMPDAFIGKYWSYELRDDKDPRMLYHKPLRWKPVNEQSEPVDYSPC